MMLNPFRLARKGKRVLLCDVDAQGPLTASLGYQRPDQIETAFASVMAHIILNEPLRIHIRRVRLPQPGISAGLCKNFIFFPCPLDGERFRKGDRSVASVLLFSLLLF